MHKKNKYWQLFLSTFKLSACTFGGGFVIIPLMQSDARLIQNVRHTDQTRSNLRRQTNPLRLSAG